MKRNHHNASYPPPPPNLLGEGPIPINRIRRNGDKLFGMLKGIHSELKFMDNNHISDGREIWNPVSSKTNIIGHKMEERMNGKIVENDIYSDGTFEMYPEMVYQQVSNMENYNQTYSQQEPFQNYNNRTNIKNKTMSKIDDDISEYLGGTTVGDSFDNTIFINMDKTNKAILANTTKLCKLLGVLIQVESKNGSRLDKMIEKINNPINESYDENYDLEDENTGEVE